MTVEDKQKVLEGTEFESEKRDVVKVGNSKGVTFPSWWFRVKRFIRGTLVLTPMRDEKGRLCILIEMEDEKLVAK